MDLRRRKVSGRVRRVMAIVALALAVATTSWVLLTLVHLEYVAARDRPDATHRLEREPEPRSWSRVASGLATIFYVQAQRSLLVGPAVGFTIGGAWVLLVSTRRT